MKNLEISLKHSFKNPRYISQALTHTSIAPTHAESNELLEFLGDRVLGLVIAEMLIEHFPEEEEGDLGYRYTALVRRETLSRVARELKLGEYIKLSSGEQRAGGADKDGVLANACEAVIAALYLDGGLMAAEQFIRDYWKPMIESDPFPQKDPKTKLQEWAQSNKSPLPSYSVLRLSGPDHAPTFTIEVKISDGSTEIGSGPNKRAAEQAAAKALLKRLLFKDSND